MFPKTVLIGAAVVGAVLVVGSQLRTASEEQMARAASDTAGSATSSQAAVADLQDLDGNTLGTVTFTETPSRIVHVVVSATDVPEGVHGFHIHETGACDASTGFTSADGHLAGDRKHGLVEGGPHPGDLPNVHVHADGKLDVEYFIAGPEDERDGWIESVGLFDTNGSAVVLHAGADDYESQPSGAAGDRIACGVIVERE
ncbi:superoxide dismutase family protein [Rhodospira trueperi]|uniref:Superoxide dismutase, Cu-Zn family n=1 Tax=Rhodospira trueperi TaxID=69960 RepID=A0A1G7BK03_9PROT|nr:superoxide dismutase family protein [Rhodospira trueperi]SDE27222.1 superoxide dismutase, Cu-Zn family [Rhodospira trueperi]